MCDDRLQMRIETLPGLQRDDAFAGSVRLVEAGRVIELRDPIKPERDVGAWPDEFDAVDEAGFGIFANVAIPAYSVLIYSQD